MSEYLRRVKQLERQPESRLSRLDIELTERCNNRCIHCYINQPADDQGIKGREMDTAFVQSVLRQAADLGCLSVRFTGGEPLLREDFEELYLFARSLGLKVLIFTNARLINNELAQLFARFPPGKLIEVTVYGMRAASYDEVAGVSGAFKQFWSGLTLLQKHNIPFVLKQSLLPQNRSELPEFEAFAEKVSFRNQKPRYVLNYDLRARRDNEVKNNVIKRLRFSPEETLRMLTRNPEEYINGMKIFARKYLRPSGSEIFNCGADLRVSVDSFGNAQMCMLLRHPDTIYPLDLAQHKRKNPDTDLLPMEYALTKFFPRVRQKNAVNQEYLQRCAVCFLKCLCEQCPAKSWEEHGTLSTPVDYLCQVAHIQAVYLGLLIEGEKSWELKPELWEARLKTFISETIS